MKKFSSRGTAMKYRLLATLPIYLALYALSLIVSFALRYEFQFDVGTTARLVAWLPVVLIVKGAVFTFSREWRRRHRYTNLSDILFVAAGSCVGSAILFGVNAAGVMQLVINRSILLIDCGLTILATLVLRSAIRMLLEEVSPHASDADKQRTLIYGADAVSVGMLRTIQSTIRGFKVVGLCDPTGDAAKSLIAGIPVFSTHRGIGAVAERVNAQHLLIPSTVSGKTTRDLYRSCHEAGIKAHVIPALNEIVDGRVKLTVRDVTISDLLRREPTKLDMDGIGKYIEGRTVLVTGAAGSIGSELCRQIAGFRPAKLIFVDHSEFGMFQIEQEFVGLKITDTELHHYICDLNDQVTLGRIFAQHLPEVVFHAAAYKHVPLMEHNPQIAIRNNVFGTKSVVDLSDRFGVERFVMISTDKAVRPTSVMGSTKLVAEKYLQSVAVHSKTEFITVRFGNVLNSAGSVVPTFRRQILEGGPLTVTHPEMTRFFMTIPEAVLLVLQAGAVGESGQVLILDMGEPVKIVDLARDMIELSGLRYPEDIDIQFSGLRPGEKMYEELFYGNEKHAKKVHEKIFCAEREPIHPNVIKLHMSQLDRAVRASTAEARNVLADVVSQYVAADETVTQKKAA